MSKKTIYYRQLARNIYKLNLLLLPTVNPAGAYTKDDEIKIKTFRVMAHAELEYYIECQCKTIAEYTYNSINANSEKIVRKALKSHSSYKESSFSTKKTDQQIIKDYIKGIEKNHGIKEENVYNLFQPLGINIEMIDPLILVSFNDYGSKRGFLAHNSIAKNPQNPTIRIVYDPSIEYNEIKGVLKMIKKMDRVCRHYQK